MAAAELVGNMADVVRLWDPDSSREAESRCKILRNSEGPYRGSGPSGLKLLQGLPENMIIKLLRTCHYYDETKFEARAAADEASVLYKRMLILLDLLKFLRACQWQGLPGVPAAMKRIQDAQAKLNEAGCNVNIFSFDAAWALERWYKAQQKAVRSPRQKPHDDDAPERQQQGRQQRQHADDSLTLPLLSARS